MWERLMFRSIARSLWHFSIFKNGLFKFKFNNRTFASTLNLSYFWPLLEHAAFFGTLSDSQNTWAQNMVARSKKMKSPKVVINLYNDDFVLGLNQFSLLHQLLQKIKLNSKVVKSDSKLIISFR